MPGFRVIHIATQTTFAVIGALSVYVAADSALGGTATLGLQLEGSFLTATDPQAYAIRDSHVRFLGAVWAGVGAIFLAGAVWPDRLRDALLVACGLGALGGLARFSGMGFGELIDAGLGLPLAVELVLFPGLAVLVLAQGRGRPAAAQPSWAA